MNTTQNYKFLGNTNDVTDCECCGRRGLKKTVAIVALDADGNPDGDPVYYGTTCAGRALGVSASYVTAAAATGDRVKREAVEVARLILAKYPAPTDGALRDYLRNNPGYASQRTLRECRADLVEMIEDARGVLELYGLSA